MQPCAQMMEQIYQGVQAMHQNLSAMLATLAQAQQEADQQQGAAAGGNNGAPTEPAADAHGAASAAAADADGEAGQ